MESIPTALKAWYTGTSAVNFDFDRVTPEISAAASLYGYGGFDTKQCCKIATEMAMQNGRKERGFMNDLSAIISMYLFRGTNLSTIRAEMCDTGKAFFDDLIAMYDLRSGNLPNNGLTLARVSLTFSGLTVTKAIKWKDSLPVPHSRMNSIVPNYPAAMMTTAFSGLIPHGEAYTSTITNAHFLYLKELIKFTDPQMRFKPHWEVIESFKGFASAAPDNCPLDKADCVELMEKWGILVAGVCSEPVTKAAERFREYLQPSPQGS